MAANPNSPRRKSARDLVAEIRTSSPSSSSTPQSTMSSSGAAFWTSVKLAANGAAQRTKSAAAKTKLRADVALIDREINNRKREFGVQMYDQLSPLVSSVDFYCGPMCEDETLTEIARPPLINAHKEIAALESKVCALKEDISAAEVGRASAYGAASQTIGEKLQKAGRTASKAGVEGKLKAELLMLQGKIKTIKQEFGMELFGEFAALEDRENWLPNDRAVRAIYDNCRQDIESIELKRKQKQQELAEMG
mmetsp:Transcript_32936/g.72245  ORF Transcript_32936/g.72245 Transcript_32936/m.72245 type:complete len:251 (+) Transcript_32936:315-1067(+)